MVSSEFIVKMLNKRNKPMTSKELCSLIEKNDIINKDNLKKYVLSTLSYVNTHGKSGQIVYVDEYLPDNYYGLNGWVSNGKLRTEYKL